MCDACDPAAYSWPPFDGPSAGTNPYPPAHSDHHTWTTDTPTWVSPKTVSQEIPMYDGMIPQHWRQEP
jgi:hypothetical protein